MPLCWVFERKKGTVCRAGLDRRVQSKCLVAELLSREQKVAHNVVVSFLLHQIETSFFFFSFLWEACSSWTHAGGWNETSASGKLKKKNWNKRTKTKQKKKNPVYLYSTFQHTSNRQQTGWNLVLFGRWKTMQNGLIVGLGPHPTFHKTASRILKGSWEALTNWGRGFVTCTVQDHPAVSTQALNLLFLSILITTLRGFKLLVNDSLKSRTEGCRGRRAKRRPGSSLIWAPGRSADTVSDSPHASARLENCADKPTALWNETSFSRR